MEHRMVCFLRCNNPSIGGAVVLHKLCHILNNLGYNASLYATEKMNGILDYFVLNENFNTKIATSIDIKNDILGKIDNDSIIILDIEENVQIMVSSTTIYEQNEKCYYTSTSYKDCTLYPDEKMAMMFELVNC